MLEADIPQTLALVNVARQAFGKPMLSELPDSRPGASSDCLFYRALADVGCTSVDGSGNIKFDDPRKATYVASLWGAQAEGSTVKTAKHGVGGFGRVIEEFDHSRLPHYNTDIEKDF
jgi:hypothetical protein